MVFPQLTHGAVCIHKRAGFLHSGMTSWREERPPVAQIDRLAIGDLHARAGELQILDVRERSEGDTEDIPGSTHTPYHDIDASPEWTDPGQWERGAPRRTSGRVR
jgi:hypothetical protein